MKNNKIFIFSGKARSGKDSSCEYLKKKLLQDNIPSAQLLYAKYIKQYAQDYFGWNGKEETKPRKLLQELGTDIIRKKLNKPNFHVNRICEDIEILNNYFNVFLISDCRFENEIEIPKKQFGNQVISIRLIRENYKSELTEEQQNHISETALDNYNNFDYVIKANDLNKLYLHLDRIYEIEVLNGKNGFIPRL